jgi:hypothetical protein
LDKNAIARWQRKFREPADLAEDKSTNLMDAIAVGNALTWCLFALGVACAITFSSMIYDELVTRKQQKQDTGPTAKVVQASISDPKPARTVSEKRASRGYDSPELFREDLWLRRIELSREESVSMEASVPAVQAAAGAGEDDKKRLCALLAHYRGARCDN